MRREVTGKEVNQRFVRDPFQLLVKMAVRNFVDVIRDEDYMAAARSQRGADSGMIDYSIFGRNEPALHHYHNTYREALDMEPLPLLQEAS